MPNHPDGKQRTTDGEPYVLEPTLVHRIERALRQTGEFGEVRLIVVKGRLKFIQVVQSQPIRDLPG